MSKILSAAAATLFAAVSIAASSVPASAGGGFSIGFGGYGPYGGPWYGGPHGGVYVDVGPGYGSGYGPGYGNSWHKHVKWCMNHYQTYNPHTNLFKTKWGPKECNSPYF